MNDYLILVGILLLALALIGFGRFRAWYRARKMLALVGLTLADVREAGRAMEGLMAEADAKGLTEAEALEWMQVQINLPGSVYATAGIAWSLWFNALSDARRQFVENCAMIGVPVTPGNIDEVYQTISDTAVEIVRRAREGRS